MFVEIVLFNYKWSDLRMWWFVFVIVEIFLEIRGLLLWFYKIWVCNVKDILNFEFEDNWYRILLCIIVIFFICYEYKS